LRDYASRYLGVQLNITSAIAIQESIQDIHDDILRQLVSILVLKTIQPPKYFCTGTFDILKYSHFATGVPLFAHFTAPLRRYADIVVHRQLESTLTGEKHFYLDRDTVQKLAQHCNVKKEASLAARDQSKLLSLALYLVHKQDNNNLEQIHQAVVTGTKVTTTVYGEARVIAIMEDSFDISLPEFGIERRIHLANLPLWRHQYDPKARALTMFWKQGVIPSTGLTQQWSLSDDEYEEEELLSTAGPYPESTSSSSNNSLENDKQFEQIALAAAAAGIVPTSTTSTSNKRASKRASIISSRLSASTGYSQEQSSQTIQALDKIRVMLTIEMVRTPPLIRVFAANPYA
jgi:protein SSD1